MLDLTAFRLEPQTSLVLVLGMQNEYCHPGGLLYSPRHQQCVTPIRNLIGAAARHRIPVISDLLT